MGRDEIVSHDHSMYFTGKPRVYLAGPWVEREKAAEWSKLLEDAGFEITHKWWKYDGEGESKESPEFLESCARSDVNGVATADVVIVINSVKSEGKAVETGMAIAWRKPVCLIGKKAINIFYNLNFLYKVDTINEAIEWAKSASSVGVK